MTESGLYRNSPFLYDSTSPGDQDVFVYGGATPASEEVAAETWSGTIDLDFGGEEEEEIQEELPSE